MIEVIIEGINYCLNEENLTAQVIRNPERCYTGEFVVPEIVVWENVSYQVTSIGYVDFVEYGIDKVVIPATITSIAIRTLYNRFLKDLTYMGTKAQWAKVQRAKQWLGDIQVVHCTDGDIVKNEGAEKDGYTTIALFGRFQRWGTGSRHPCGYNYDCQH